MVEGSELTDVEDTGRQAGLPCQLCQHDCGAGVLQGQLVKRPWSVSCHLRLSCCTAPGWQRGSWISRSSPPRRHSPSPAATISWPADLASKIVQKTKARQDGTCSEGFRTKVLPDVTAGGHIQSGTMAGKLKGQMPATTCRFAVELLSAVADFRVRDMNFCQCETLARDFSNDLVSAGVLYDCR